MGSIPSRYQRKSATAYQKQQEAEAMALYRQMSQMQAPVVPTPAQSADKPGVVSQVASGAWHGVKKAVHEMFNSLDELSTFVAHKLPDSLGGGKGERHNFSNLLNAITGNAASGATLKAEEKSHDSTAYNVSSGIAQFVTAFVPINRTAGALTKGLKLGKAATVATKIAQGAAAGGVASAVAFDPYEARLSNMIQQVPALQNPITEYLQASPDDPKAVARMKNGVENALLGIGVDLGVEGAKGLFNSIKAFKAGKLKPDEGVLEMKKYLSQKQPVTR